MKEKRPSWSSQLEKWSRILWPVLIVGLIIPYVVVVLNAPKNIQCNHGGNLQFNTSYIPLSDFEV